MELTIDQALKKGAEAQKLGRVEEARRIYLAILKVYPKHPDANHNMGTLLAGVSKIKESKSFFKAALYANDNIGQFWFSYIEVLIKLKNFGEAKILISQAKRKNVDNKRIMKLEQLLEASQKINWEKVRNSEPSKFELQPVLDSYKNGQHEKALSLAKKLLQKHSNSVNLFNICGAINVGLKRFENAIEAYEKALSLKPDHAQIYNNMGIAFKEQGKLSEAIAAYEKALSLKSDFSEVHYNVGNILKIQGKLEEAIEAYKRAISLNPDNNEVYNNMGTVFKGLGKLDEAIAAYRKAISVKPNYAEAYNNIGNVLRTLNKPNEAVINYQKAISIKPDYAEAYNNMGAALKDLDKLNEAIESYQKAISLNPLSVEARGNLGLLLTEQGKIEDAIVIYNQALSIDPNAAELHRQLSLIMSYQPQEGHFLQVRRLLKSPLLSKNDLCSLNFALGKMYEDMGDLKKAFSCFRNGNLIRKEVLGYSIQQDKTLFYHLKRVQPTLIKNNLKKVSNFKRVVPVFILGMPRSGTTLVEQIVSAHSKVEGLGELKEVFEFGAKIATGYAVANIENISTFRRKYISAILRKANGKSFVTDKMPQNFRFVPLICAAFPEAKIIHVRRNPAATCWSNYRNYFASPTLGYCNDLKDVTEYYKLYVDLIASWSGPYGSKIYELDYDKLVEDQESTSKNLIRFLELDWEDDCLEPEKNLRLVKTVSSLQVREKIYKKSSRQWLKYETYINGIFDQLMP